MSTTTENDPVERAYKEWRWKIGRDFMTGDFLAFQAGYEAGNDEGFDAGRDAGYEAGYDSALYSMSLDN